MNYGNKNSSCAYTNQDLLKGYFAAVSSSLIVALSLRRMTAGIAASATGVRLLLLNAGIGASAGACASYCNTSMMRMAEVE